MPTLALTAGEIDFLLNFVPPLSYLPARESDTPLINAPNIEAVGGLPFRHKLISARKFAVSNPRFSTVSVEMTDGELWIVDVCLWNQDYRQARIGSYADSPPITGLLEKVWNALTTAEGQPTEPAVPPLSPDEQRRLLERFDKQIEDASA